MGDCRALVSKPITAAASARLSPPPTRKKPHPTKQAHDSGSWGERGPRFCMSPLPFCVSVYRDAKHPCAPPSKLRSAPRLTCIPDLRQPFASLQSNPAHHASKGEFVTPPKPPGIRAAGARDFECETLSARRKHLFDNLGGSPMHTRGCSGYYCDFSLRLLVAPRNLSDPVTTFNITFATICNGTPFRTHNFTLVEPYAENKCETKCSYSATLNRMSLPRT